MLYLTEVLWSTDGVEIFTSVANNLQAGTLSPMLKRARTPGHSTMRIPPATLPEMETSCCNPRAERCFTFTLGRHFQMQRASERDFLRWCIGRVQLKRTVLARSRGVHPSGGCSRFQLLLPLRIGQLSSSYRTTDPASVSILNSRVEEVFCSRVSVFFQVSLLSRTAKEIPLTELVATQEVPAARARRLCSWWRHERDVHGEPPLRRQCGHRSRHSAEPVLNCCFNLPLEDCMLRSTNRCRTIGKTICP